MFYKAPPQPAFPPFESSQAAVFLLVFIFQGAQLSLVMRVESLDVRVLVTAAIKLAWWMKDLYHFPLVMQARNGIFKVLVDAYNAC